MTPSSLLSFTLDGRLLRHPRAIHMRRMRMGIWLYLDLLARTGPLAESLEIEPSGIAAEMGVEEGFVRSWLGHLSKAGYLTSERLNGKLRVTIRRGFLPVPAPSVPARFFTVTKLQEALGDQSNAHTLEEALRAHPDRVIRKALAGALAVPEAQIRRSRTALFLYLLKRAAHANN